MDWCRLYGKTLDDPKVGTLSDAEFRTWIELQCVATKADANGSTELTPEQIDWALRRNASVTLQVLLHRGLVTLNETGVVVISEWDERQKRGDSSADRVRKFRANQRVSNAEDDVTLPKRDGNALEKNREEERREEKKEKTNTPRVPRFDAQARLESLSVEPKIAKDWLEQRKAKHLKPTETAIDGVVEEAEKAGISLNDALKEACTRGWGSFKAEWLKRESGGGSPVISNRFNRQEALEQQNRKVAMEFAFEGDQRWN